jgi:hypothetical protein
MRAKELAVHYFKEQLYPTSNRAISSARRKLQPEGNQILQKDGFEQADAQIRDAGSEFSGVISIP